MTRTEIKLNNRIQLANALEARAEDTTEIRKEIAELEAKVKSENPTSRTFVKFSSW